MTEDKAIGTEALVMLLAAEFQHYSEVYGKKIAQKAAKTAYTKVFQEGKGDGKQTICSIIWFNRARGTKRMAH